MAIANQTHRAIQIKTSPGKGDLLLKSLTGTERISGLFQLDLALLTENVHVNTDDLLGAALSVSFKRGDGGGRFFHGFVTEIVQSRFGRPFHEYHVTLRPWLWFLTRTTDCRVFQKKSVPEIFEEVAKGYGIANYKLRLKDTYHPLEYCVQYRETDFDFVSRLLEQEGIRYYFEHLDGSHLMVLADDDRAHDTATRYQTVPFFAPGLREERRTRDHLSDWSLVKSVQPGAYATLQFDFEKPAARLQGAASMARKHAHSNFERFEYPARLSKLDIGVAEHAAKMRIEELQATYMVARGQGNAAGLSAGLLFTLAQHPRAELNIDYVVTEAHYTLTAGDYQTGGTQDDIFEIAVTAIDARTMFRPPRITPKPVIQGAQTGIVVGKKDAEIYTDKYGRVKVQFHWDRAGAHDEASSCWIRVAQLWAGAGWGSLYIPRVGQEVVVSFLEGDPDQPLVTGAVYNARAMPPYAVPDAATQSGIKSKSSPKGDASAHFNELRFEDKKGAEEIYLHAEKNLSVVVQNDQTITIGLEKKDKGARTTQIHQDDTLKIGRHRVTEIAQDDTLNIKGDRKEDVSKNTTETVGKAYKLSAGDSITLESGAARIILNKNGDIEISGKKIALKATAEITQSANQKICIDAAMDVKVSATQVLIEARGKTEVKGTLLDLAATAVATLKGALTKIN
ncbi:MAG: type secretion system Vgr family protein [Gammaproteobacteria bacterium]|nr:type secretion system Vgr family protein [Gammaproteobacteria bacterium]